MFVRIGELYSTYKDLSEKVSRGEEHVSVIPIFFGKLQAVRRRFIEAANGSHASYCFEMAKWITDTMNNNGRPRKDENALQYIDRATVKAMELAGGPSVVSILFERDNLDYVSAFDDAILSVLVASMDIYEAIHGADSLFSIGD